eukprot:COSAG02_NODE_61433_length_268_cov_1.124260_1_plen_53_part_10
MSQISDPLVFPLHHFATLAQELFCLTSQPKQPNPSKETASAAGPPPPPPPPPR